MADIIVVRTAELTERTVAQTRALLDAAFGGDFDPADWAHALGGWHVLAVAGGDELVAHGALVARSIAVAGRPFRAGYIEALATSPPRQRAGTGSAVMRELARLLVEHFEIGVLSTGAHGFYARLGWERWQGPTYVRRGEGADDVVRSPDDDDSVMVLRFGRSLDVSLAEPICCEARDGDDW